MIVTNSSIISISPVIGCSILQLYFNQYCVESTASVIDSILILLKITERLTTAGSQYVQMLSIQNVLNASIQNACIHK